MNAKLNLFVTSIVCGLCLAVFSLIPSFVKFAFSLVAFFVGLRFFGQYDSWKMRLALIAISIIWYFLFVIIYTFLAIANNWYLPAMPDAL